jgi:hypothetical protein
MESHRSETSRAGLGRDHRYQHRLFGVYRVQELCLDGSVLSGAVELYRRTEYTKTLESHTDCRAGFELRGRLRSVDMWPAPMQNLASDSRISRRIALPQGCLRHYGTAIKD